MGHQRLNVGLADSAAPGPHKRRLTKRGPTVTDDSREVGIADLVECVAVGEGCGLISRLSKFDTRSTVDSGL